jgi:hypothetical protein
MYNKVFISDCIVNESSMIIEIEYKNVHIFEIIDVRIDYINIHKTIKFLGDDGEVNYEKTKSRIIICLDLTDKVLYTNEKAKLTIKVSGGFIHGYIVVEDKNQSTEPFYTFPNKEYKNFVISILSQGYGLKI